MPSYFLMFYYATQERSVILKKFSNFLLLFVITVNSFNLLTSGVY